MSMNSYLMNFLYVTDLAKPTLVHKQVILDVVTPGFKIFNLQINLTLLLSR
jgi:hypothetical protein